MIYGGFMDTESVWRVTATEDQMLTVTKGLSELDLIERESTEIPEKFEFRFPLFWRPSRTADCRFFTTPDFPWDSRGHDGNQLAIMYDAKTLHLYVWNKDNF